LSSVKKESTSSNKNASTSTGELYIGHPHSHYQQYITDHIRPIITDRTITTANYQTHLLQNTIKITPKIFTILLFSVIESLDKDVHYHKKNY